MRKLVSIAFLAAALLAASATPAGAAVTIGQTFTPDTDFGGSGVFIQSGSPPGNSYKVPFNGVITSWSFEAVAGPTPPLKLKVVRRATGSDFTTIGDSQLETPTPASLNTWPTRIAVNAGDVLAEFYSDTTISYRDVPGFITNEISGDPGDPGLDAPPGTTITYEPDNTNSHQIDMSAVLEADADRDAFGDETQDKCVGTAGTANGCPSVVTVGKVKQKGTKPKLKVTATVPGAGTLSAGSPSDPALASAAAKSLKSVTKTVTAITPQQVVLTLKLTKSAKRKLADSGKLKTKVKVVYTPVGGPPGSQTKKAKLKNGRS